MADTWTMRKLLLNRHESETGAVSYRDVDKRYAVFEDSDGNWVMCQLSRSGCPDRMLGQAVSLDDARRILRIERGPFSRADYRTVIAGVAIGCFAAWLFAAGIVSLKALIIGVAVAVGLLMLATVVLGFILCYIIAKAFEGFTIF